MSKHYLFGVLVILCFMMISTSCQKSYLDPSLSSFDGTSENELIMGRESKVVFVDEWKVYYNTKEQPTTSLVVGTWGDERILSWDPIAPFKPDLTLPDGSWDDISLYRTEDSKLALQIWLFSEEIRIKEQSELRWLYLPHYFKHWEYRVDEMTSFTITADKTLFGVKPGESLNDYFYVTVDDRFIFDSNKTIITDSLIIRNTKIDKLLEYHPMSPAAMKFSMISNPPEAPIEVNFSVNMGIKGKQTLQATTRQQILVK